MAKIENKAQYDWAVKRVDELLKIVNDETPQTDPNMIELKLLSDMVADYSEANFAIGEPKLTDILKLRMFEMGITQSKLASIIGVSQSRLSEYLTGKSEPTLKVGREMCRKLEIPAEIVLGV